MSSSSISVTKKQNVFLAHICSGCGFPVLAVACIEARASKQYAISQSKAEKIASETASEAITSEIAHIKECSIHKRPLIETKTGSHMITPGHFCGSSIRGFVTPCPMCGHVELWKNKDASIDELKRLSNDYFPVVFTIIEDATTWAFAKVMELIKEIEEKRCDTRTVQDSINKISDLYLCVVSLEKQIKSLPELAEKAQLESQIKKLRELKSNAGLLDFRIKKETSHELQVLELKQTDIQKRVNEKKASLNTALKQKKIELLYNQAIAFGCSNETQRKGLATIAFHYTPMSIPKPLLEEIQRKNQSINVDKKIITNSPILYCRKCGYKLVPESVFCSKCGTRIDN